MSWLTRIFALLALLAAVWPSGAFASSGVYDFIHYDDAQRSLQYVDHSHPQMALLLAPHWSVAGVKACPFGAGLGDGCPTPNGGTFLYAPGLAGLRQSGQAWYAPHPMSWNVAGIDYKIGAYTPRATMLLDPTTYDPFINIPANCVTGHVIGGAPNPGKWMFNGVMDYLYCSGSPASFNIKHYYFGAWPSVVFQGTTYPAHNAVGLFFAGSAPLNIEDVYVINDSNTTNTTSFWSGFGQTGWFFSNAAQDQTFTSVTFEGNDTQNCCIAGWADFLVFGNPSGNVTMNYVALTDFPSYFANFNVPINKTLKFTNSVFAGCNERSYTGHTECITNGDAASYDWSYDTILINSKGSVALQAWCHCNFAPTGASALVSLQNNLLASNCGMACNLAETSISFTLNSGLLTLTAPSSFGLRAGAIINGTNLSTFGPVLAGDGLAIGSQIATDCVAQNQTLPWCTWTNSMVSATYTAGSGELDLTFSFPPLGTSGIFIGFPYTVAGMTGVGSDIATVNGTKPPIIGYSPDFRTVKLQSTAGLNITSIDPNSGTYAHGAFPNNAATTTAATQTAGGYGLKSFIDLHSGAFGVTTAIMQHNFVQGSGLYHQGAANSSGFLETPQTCGSVTFFDNVDLLTGAGAASSTGGYNLWSTSFTLGTGC